LFPAFQNILVGDVQEFVPYVFQVLSLLLEMHTDGSIPEPYMVLFEFLLAPVLWERPGNIKPLVRLLQAYITRGPQQIVATNKIDALLGIFQKLIASKSNDHEGFYLLQSMIEHVPFDAMNNYVQGIFSVLFKRLTSSKTTKFVKGFLVFFFLYITKFGGSSFIEIIDGIQPNLFGMVCDRLIILEVQKVTGTTEKKICSVGMIKLLTETPALTTGNYSHYWPPIMTALVGLFELPVDDTVPDDEHFIEIEDTPGYQTAYSQLIYAGKREHDPLAVIENPKVSVVEYMYCIILVYSAKII
jgi:exportin-2 (importin alpha re-exporter)